MKNAHKEVKVYWQIACAILFPTVSICQIYLWQQFGLFGVYADIWMGIAYFFYALVFGIAFYRKKFFYSGILLGLLSFLVIFKFQFSKFADWPLNFNSRNASQLIQEENFKIKKSKGWSDEC